MNFIIGSGNNRQKVTIPSGFRMRQMEKNDPIGYVKLKGNIMSAIRGNS